MLFKNIIFFILKKKIVFYYQTDFLSSRKQKSVIKKSYQLDHFYHKTNKNIKKLKKHLK